MADRLASSLGEDNSAPNIALAETLARSGNTTEIAELADLLIAARKPLRHDAIKTLYELGERRPDLIAPHLEAFLALLDNNDNRMVWGTMSALAALAPAMPEQLMKHLNTILEAADRSTVITKDKCMVILSALNSQPKFNPIVTPVILDRLRHAAVNQLPMYAELSAPTITGIDLERFAEVINERLSSLSYPAKRKRLEKVLKGLEPRRAHT